VDAEGSILRTGGRREDADREVSCSGVDLRRCDALGVTRGGI
jgi:hypothetical protein